MDTETGNGHGATLDKLMTDLRVVVEDGQQLLKTGAKQLRQKAVIGARATDEQIRRNPYPSLGIIFGLGLVVGILGYTLLKSGADQLQNDLD